jgi:cardiolipin synthase
VVRVIDGVPERLRVYRTVELLAAGARERLWITDAYMLPPQVMYASFIAAARDGVDVRQLLPGRSDIPLLNTYARQGYRQLLQAGVRIWEWAGAMLHAKTVIADGTWLKVGSSNLNVSSLWSNYEVDVLVEDQRATLEAVGQFRTDLARSVEIVLREPRWAPRRLAAVVPQPAGTGAAAPAPARLTTRERSRRAVVTLAHVAAGARRSLAGATVFALAGVGALLLVLPRQMAYILAFVAFWLGGSAAWHFLREHRRPDE